MNARAGLIAAALVLSACQTTGSSSQTAASSYSWPDFQSGLRTGPSWSKVKATLPENLSLTAASTKDPAKAAYGGIWAGWMCRDRVRDVKVSVSNVTDNGATVHYATATDSSGKFDTTVDATFSGDVLRGTFANGAGLVLGMRSDGYMNIKYDATSWCSGIMMRTKALPTS